MPKFAPILLVVVGLAVGLWLGFNPQAHQQIVQSWNHARTAVVHATAQLRLKPAPLASIKIGAPTHVQAPNASSAWLQIRTAFESLVSSLQRLWVSVTARIPNAR